MDQVARDGLVTSIILKGLSNETQMETCVTI